MLGAEGGIKAAEAWPRWEEPVRRNAASAQVDARDERPGRRWEVARAGVGCGEKGMGELARMDIDGARL